MKGSLSLIFALFIIFAASAQNDNRITLVEDGLLPAVQPQNDTLIHFNISDRMKFYGVNAVSIAVIDSGKLQWAKAYGFADETLQKKADTNTLFQAASITKSFNAVCVFRLAAQQAVIRYRHSPLFKNMEAT